MSKFTQQSLLEEVTKVRTKLINEQGRWYPFTKEEVRNGLTAVLTAARPLEERLTDFISFGTTVLVMYYEFLWDSPISNEGIATKLIQSSKQVSFGSGQSIELIISSMINGNQPLNHTLHHAIAKAIAYLN